MRVLVVRHGCAGDKRQWQGPDAERPLDAAGVRQAAALADELVGIAIRRIATSPTRRCRDTVAPLARRLGLAIEQLEGLDRSNDGEALTELITGDGARDAVLCTHGENMRAALVTIRSGGVLNDTHDEDLLLAKGTAWVVTVDASRTIVALDHLAPDPAISCPTH